MKGHVVVVPAGVGFVLVLWPDGSTNSICANQSILGLAPGSGPTEYDIREALQAALMERGPK